MSSAEITREWIIAAGGHICATVMQYRDRVRSFCVNELGMQWETGQRDTAYFAEAMRKAREAQKDRAKRLRALIPKRGVWEPAAMEASGISSEANDFLAALLDDTRDLPTSTFALLHWASRQIELDLRAVERHLLEHLGMEEIDIRNIPAVAADARVDIVFKFIAAIFLQHAGLVTITQPTADTVYLVRRASRAVVEART